MTPRERQLATIRRQPADRVSTDVICIENVGEIAAVLGVEPESCCRLSEAARGSWKVLLRSRCGTVAQYDAGYGLAVCWQSMRD